VIAVQYFLLIIEGYFKGVLSNTDLNLETTDKT